MATCRDLIKEAVSAFEGLAMGDELTQDEITYCLTAIQREIRRYHEALGPMSEVDVTTDYTPGENTRVRVQDGASISITLPNSVGFWSTSPDNDYWFYHAPTDPVQGYTTSADGSARRAPRDGSRIEVVATNRALWFYRADTNEWVECSNLSIDGSMPLNEALLSDFAAILAMRLCKAWPAAKTIVPSEQMKREFGQANLRLYGRPGVARDPVRADYF